jgi:hypothetical protein
MTLIATFDRKLEQLEERLRRFFDDHPDLKHKKQLLESIKGIGETTVIHLLAEMYDLDQYENARAAAPDAGITAAHYPGKAGRLRPLPFQDVPPG